LIIVDEVGYIPFEQDAANLFFQLVSSRYEHASSSPPATRHSPAEKTSSATKSSPQR
jgi:DNA replication protein DnaC